MFTKRYVLLSIFLKSGNKVEILCREWDAKLNQVDGIPSAVNSLIAEPKDDDFSKDVLKFIDCSQIEAISSRIIKKFSLKFWENA